MDHAPRRSLHAPRRWRWARRLALAFALVDAGALSAAPAHAAGSGTFDLQVSDSQAAFQVSALKPGPVGQRCLVLRAQNGSADLARLWVSAGGTGLASYLDVVLERGPAAGAAGCASLATTPLYVGTLADLAAAHPSAAEGLSVPFDPTSDASLRITISLHDDNAAQGLSASAVFSFQAEDTTPAGAPTSAPTVLVPTSATVPGTSATPSSPPSSSPAPGGSPANGSAATTPTADALPSTTATPPASTPPDRARSVARPTTTAPGGGSSRPSQAPGSAASEVVVTDPTSTVDDPGFFPRLPQAVKTTVALTAKAGSVPAAFLGLVFVFLLVQDRIDRNDPKLARAPLRPDPEIVFVPRYEVTA